MKKYIWIVAAFFILLYFGPSLTAPVTHRECVEAEAAAQLFANGKFAIESLDRYLAGFALSVFGNNPLGLRMGNILVVALMSFLGMFAIKKCINDTMTGLMSSLLFFTSFWCFYTPLIPQNTVWGEFFNVLALGAFFMASRENRFSMQRISLLILCGFMTALSLIMNGMSPFVMSFCIAVLFLLAERKYPDMFYMPLLISAVTVGFLVLHGYYIHNSLWYELDLLAGDFVASWQVVRVGSVDSFLRNLRLMVLGVLPSLPFLICALCGYKGYVKHFFCQSIFRFCLIFLGVGIVSVLLNREVFLADLPLTYLPYSFLVGAGFVNYMRTRNRHIVFELLMLFFALGILGLAVYHLVSCDFEMSRKFAIAGIIWSGFILLSYIRPKTGSRIKAYFLGLSVALFASMTVVWDQEISAAELDAVMRIAVDPAQEDAYEMYASAEMYPVVRFYLPEKKVRRFDAGKLSAESLKEIQNTLCSKDIIVFAIKDEMPEKCVKKARTVDAGKFRLHLFMRKK